MDATKQAQEQPDYEHVYPPYNQALPPAHAGAAPEPLRSFDLRTAPEIVHDEIATLRSDLATLRTDMLILRDERMEANERLALLESVVFAKRLSADFASADFAGAPG